MIPTEVFQIFIIFGNILGWWGIYKLVDRKVDKKIMKYWHRARSSPEGQDLFTILRETKILLQSEEPKKLFVEAAEILGEVRFLLKKIKERAEATEEDGDVQEPLLPSL